MNHPYKFTIYTHSRLVFLFFNLRILAYTNIPTLNYGIMECSFDYFFKINFIQITWALINTCLIGQICYLLSYRTSINSVNLHFYSIFSFNEIWSPQLYQSLSYRFEFYKNASYAFILHLSLDINSFCICSFSFM